MPYINTITSTILESTKQAFSQASIHATNASNGAEKLQAINTALKTAKKSKNKNATEKLEAEKLEAEKSILNELSNAIVHIMKIFDEINTMPASEKLFLPFIEEFIFSFISKTLYELKKFVGNDYSGLLDTNNEDEIRKKDAIRKKDEILKIEIYLNEQIMQLQDYQRSLQLTDKTRIFITEWQKTPLKKIDWKGLQLYKTELTRIQEDFKIYKINLNLKEWLKPLSEFPAKLKLITPIDTSLDISKTTTLTSSTITDELELCKDVYALKRILNYIDLAIAIEPDKNPLGPTIIERALQVAGEYFKSTKESSHLSTTMEQKLRSLNIPIKRIATLRNSLSHSGSFIFSIREKIKHNASQVDFFKGIQQDLTKIKVIVIKILSRINFKKTKAQIADIATTNSNAEIQPLLTKITSSEDLDKIAPTLNEILIKIESLNLSETEKQALKLPIEGIRANLNLKNIDKSIRGLEAINLNEDELETPLANLEDQLKSDLYDELQYFKNNRVSPSKSAITALSETPGLENFPIDTHKINLPHSNLDLFNLLVKKTFKKYSILYSNLLSSAIGLEKDESLLVVDIKSFASRHNLSPPLQEEQQELINNFKLFSLIEPIKSKFLKNLEKIDYAPIEASVLQEIAVKAKLDEKQKKLLKLNLLELHQELFFNQFFENYFDALLAEIKGKITETEFNTLVDKINQQKELHRTIKKLLDYTNNLSDMQKLEYQTLINDITSKLIPITPKQQQESLKKSLGKLRTNYLDKTSAKATLENLQYPYKNLLNGIKKEELISDIVEKFKKFSNSLRLTHNIKDQLDTLFEKTEIARFEKLFLEKLAALDQLLNLKKTTHNPQEIQASYEILLSDLTNIWRNILKVSDPLLRNLPLEHLLLTNTSIDESFSLRNYLAHGDPLFDAMHPNFIKQISENIPTLVKNGKALLALKRLLDVKDMRDYLLDDIIAKDRIAQLSDQGLPSHLQMYSELISEYKQSPSWKNDLERLNPNTTPVATVSADQSKDLVKALFERELREAASSNDISKLNYCIQQGIDIEAADEKNWSAIYYAIDARSYDTFDILEKNANLDRIDIAGFSPIHYAVINPDARLANTLITKKQLQYSAKKEPWSLLHLAGIRDNRRVIDALLENKINIIEETNHDGFTVLLLAVYFGHTELAEHLITTYKANIHATTTNKNSIAHLAVLNNNPALLKKLKTLDNTLALDVANEAKWAAIHYAALKDLPDFLKYFIENGVDPNLKGRDGSTALHLAAQIGQVENVDYLMQVPSIIVDTIDEHGRSALLTAVAHQQYAAVEKILAFPSELIINLPDKQGWSPLHVAVSNNNLEISKLLLKMGAQIDQKIQDDLTPAHIATVNGYLEILEWLKSEGADFNIKTKSSWTLLHLASLHDRPHIIDYLLNIDKDSPLDININALTDDGFTALHFAAVEGYTDNVEKLAKAQNILIDKKTIRIIQNDSKQFIKIEGATASHLAAQNGHLLTLKKLEENGADLTLTDNREWTHLHLAANSGHANIVDYFLEKKPQIINIEAKTKLGETALHLAAYQGHDSIVNDLLVHQADVNAKTLGQDTPLHLAAITGKLTVVETLLQHSAQLDATSNGVTPLALAAQHGHLEVVKKLLSHNANVLAKNEYVTVLHRATLSNNPEIIKSIIERIKIQKPEVLEAALNAKDEKGDTPLMWAVKTQKASALEMLLQEGADSQLINSKGETAFDMAVMLAYPAIDKSDKNAIKARKIKIAHQKKMLDLLFLKKYQAPEIKTIKNKFSELINEEFRNNLYHLDFEEIETLHNTFDQTGNVAFWSSITEKVKKRIKEEYPNFATDATTQEETLALKDLMRPSTWISLDDLSLHFLNTRKLILDYKKLNEKTYFPSQASCQAESRGKRKRAAMDCLSNEETEKFDPLLEFNAKEKEAATLLMASAATAEQRTELNKNIINIAQIKAEGPLSQSQMELRKLDLFHENIEKIIAKKEQYLQKTDDINQAKLIKLSNQEGKSISLSIHSEILAGKQYLSIYCLQINGYTALQLNPNLTIDQALKLYATLLFPEQTTRSLSTEYYDITQNLQPILSDTLELLTTSDFRSDKSILESHNNFIEGLKMTEFRELFLINGEVPEIKQLHIDIFNDPEITITFRSTKIIDKLWKMSAEQQVTLATILNKYSIVENPIDTEKSLAFEVSLQQFNQLLINKLKTVTLDRPITHADLTECSQQYLQKELLAEGFAAHEVDTIINNVVDLHGGIRDSLVRATGIARQGVFFAPAIIQAMNGDFSSLDNLTIMMGSDITIDHAYQTLVSNRRFTQRFPKTASVLSKSARFISSPISKILLLYSFVELGEQMQNAKPGSPEYQLAESLLTDNEIFFTTMLAETLGLELGPAGILLDIGITIHQLLANAKHYRETLPFAISFWQSIALTLGFKKVWLDEMLTENSLWDMGLQQLNHWMNITGKSFSSGLLRVPKLEEEFSNEIDCKTLPTTIQKQIIENALTAIDLPEFKYIPRRVAVMPGVAPFEITPAKCEKKYYGIQDDAQLTISLQPTNKTIHQETSLFPRKRKFCQETYDVSTSLGDFRTSPSIYRKTVCEDKLRSDQGWIVGASTTTTDGEKFSGSPVEITGGQAVLMLSEQPNLSEKILLINFNPCFGEIIISGGAFLQDHALYVAIETITKTNLIDKKEISSKDQPIPLITTNMRQFINKIIYLVGDNYHASLIKDEDHLDTEIILLPIVFSPDLHQNRSDLNKITFSIDQEGTFYVGKIGPRFIGLDKKRKVSINFHKDYLLSGDIALKTQSLAFKQVQGNFTNPANFRLAKEQKFEINLLTGRTIYQLDASREFKVTINNSDRLSKSPQIIKSSNEAIFKFFMEEPLSDLVIVKTASSTRLSLADVLRIKKFDSNTTLSLYGNYSFKNNQTCLAELKITQKITTLTLIDITDHENLLRSPAFFNTIKQQNLNSINFYRSNTRNNTSVSLDSGKQQITYQGITYCWDSKYGLVAIQGRAQGNATEDFSDALTSLIDTQSNVTLPLRLNSTTIEFKGRQFINLKLNSYLLTAQGKVPLGLLPLQLTTPQQGDSIRLDEISNLLDSSVEIDRVSLTPDGLGDSLIVHYRPNPRLKRAISAFTTEKNSIKICFKKSDDTIPKTVVIGGKTFPIDFSELPLLNPLEPMVISHNLFKQLSNRASLQTEEINGEVLVEMRLERDKPSEQTIYRMPVNVRGKQTTFRFIDTETKREKQLSATFVPSNHSWQYATVAGATLFGVAALLTHYFKPRNNNPLPVPVVPAALPLLPMLPTATATIVNTITETTVNIVSSFWQTATWFSEKTQAEQPPVEPGIESFTNPKQQSFFDSNSFFPSNPASSLSDLGEQLCNKADKPGLLQLMHFYALSRASSKQTKVNKLQTFLPAKDKKPATITANKILGLILAETEKQAKQLGICHWDLVIKIKLTELQTKLINSIEKGEIKAIASALHTSIKGLKKFNVIPMKNVQELETYIDNLVDQVFFQNGPFVSQYRA